MFYEQHVFAKEEMGLYLFPVNPGSHLTSLGLYFSLKKNDNNSRFNFPKVTGK